MAEASPRDIKVVVAAQFGLAFSLNFMLIFLPFYIHSISPLSPAATLRWIGLIVGAASAASIVGSPFWASLTSRFSPKLLFERCLISHAILVSFMAFTTSLPVFLLLRILQGFLGGLSTIGLIIISAISPRQNLEKDVGLFQAALTLGQITGPPVGAFSAALLGYRSAFLITSFTVGLVFLFSILTLAPLPPQKVRRDVPTLSKGSLITGWFVCLTATIQIVFLPSVLPEILKGMDMTGERALKAAGLIVLTYGLASVAGSYGLPRISSQTGSFKLILRLGLGASILQALLFLGTNVLSFTIIRALQTGLVSAVLPLIIVQAAIGGRGTTIGFLNTSRFAGNALGPIMATFILANGSLLVLYWAIALFTLLSLLAFFLAPSLFRRQVVSIS